MIHVGLLHPDKQEDFYWQHMVQQPRAVLHLFHFNEQIYEVKVLFRTL